MFELEWPWLLLLAPLPLLIRWLPPLERSEAALRVPFFGAVNTLAQSGSGNSHRRLGRILALWIIWLASVLAAANPQWVGEATSMPNSGRDLLLAVDISGSMREPDMVYNNRRITRLMAVKKVVGDFVARRQSDRLGLVLFGTQAFLQAPLTFDVKTVQEMLIEAESGYAGEATAIGDAIALSIKRLREQPNAKRVIILLTDGENTAGELGIATATDLAVKANTKIYTIAFSPYDREVDSHSMQQIAEQTGGEFFRARNTRDLEEIHRQLDLLEPTAQDEATFRPVESLFYWPLAIALLTSLLLALAPMVRIPVRGNEA
ncbi:VWA domain-containing protein [Cellvibrio japonicus]|uniref:von Willebrand factor type A domain protein n=1 Tax=Cellvibrio japonicus (strain Ueda107) TaxID=498211 RepID=B3PJ55_CELJU|nr:VWA domain-containing protein [Cellvibrio japonicus]ACE84458.1 von Willebrand factor type A domain protein [Cellvibrio japonicus Ueda107]QEI12618.1 VWA domain-containing protein [Cellvibrio japonicus]QEI16192.1 VWA domain-containing protein [Cellvibrio japonicus]QEI19770.1 VWA domain-containing protein [Cellvibrio japonicus]